MSSGLLPSGSPRLPPHALSTPLPRLYKCQDIRLPRAVSLAFPTTTQCESGGELKKTAVEAGEEKAPICFSFSCCHGQLKAITITHRQQLVLSRLFQGPRLSYNPSHHSDLILLCLLDEFSRVATNMLPSADTEALNA